MGRTLHKAGKGGDVKLRMTEPIMSAHGQGCSLCTVCRDENIM